MLLPLLHFDKDTVFYPSEHLTPLTIDLFTTPVPRAGELTASFPPSPQIGGLVKEAAFLPSIAGKVKDVCNIKLLAVKPGLEPCAFCLCFSVCVCVCVIFLLVFRYPIFMSSSLAKLIILDFHGQEAVGQGGGDTHREVCLLNSFGELHVFSLRV